MLQIPYQLTTPQPRSLDEDKDEHVVKRGEEKIDKAVGVEVQDDPLGSTEHIKKRKKQKQRDQPREMKRHYPVSAVKVQAKYGKRKTLTLPALYSK